MKTSTLISLLLISIALMLSCNKEIESEDKTKDLLTKGLHSLQIILLQDGTGSSIQNYVGKISDENIDNIVNRIIISGGEFCFGLISDKNTDKLIRLNIPAIPQKELFQRSGNPLIDEQNYNKYKVYEKSIDSLIWDYSKSLKSKVDEFKQQIHGLIEKPLSRSTDYNSAIARAYTALSESNEFDVKILIIVSDSEDNMKVRPLPENFKSEIIIINPFPPEVAKKYGASCFEGITPAINYLIQNF